MDTRKVKYFVAVAQERSFSGAARKLHMSQPPLSTHIRELEEEIGVVLLHRSRRDVRLTDAGRVFLQKCNALLSDMDAAIASARQAARGEEGVIRLGVVGSALFGALPQLQREIRRAANGSIVSLIESGTADQLEAVKREQLDIGIVHYPIDTSQLQSCIIFQEPYVLAVSERHPLAQVGETSLKAFSDDVFISFSREVSPFLFDSGIAACREAGFSPRIGHAARHVLTMLHMVQSGHGVSLVPKSMSLAGVQGCCYVNLLGSSARVRLSAIWNERNQSDLVRNVVTNGVMPLGIEA